MWLAAVIRTTLPMTYIFKSLKFHLMWSFDWTDVIVYIFTTRGHHMFIIILNEETNDFRDISSITTQTDQQAVVNSTFNPLCV